MGLLCDYFIAPDDQAAAETVNWIGGPSRPPEERHLFRRLQRVDGYQTLHLDGVEPTIMMAKLEHLLIGRPFDEIRMDPTWKMLASVGNGERFVVPITLSLQEALTSIEDGRLEDVAPRWAARDDYWPGADPATAADVLKRVSDLVKAGHASGGHVYCWVCV